MHDKENRYGGSHEFYNHERHKRDPSSMTDNEVRDELRLARTRLMLAAAFVDLLRAAYQALLSHGVNYLTTRAYTDTEILDDAAKLPLGKGADRYLAWIGRVRNDITAAIARKGLKVLQAKRTPPPRDKDNK